MADAMLWSGAAGTVGLGGTYTYDAGTLMFMHSGGSIVSEVVLTYTDELGGTIKVIDNRMPTPTDATGTFGVTGANGIQVTAVNSQVSTFGN